MLRSSIPQIPVLGALLSSVGVNANQSNNVTSPTGNSQASYSTSGSRQRHGSVLTKKPSLMRKQSQLSNKSDNGKGTSGKSKSQQQIKNFCEFIQFFCSLSTGRMSLQEVEIIILNPVVVDESHRIGNKLMEEFDKLLKTAQIDPQDWFDFITRKKTQMQEFVSYSEFSAEILKLCVDLHHPLIPDDDVRQLFHHIASDRDDDCFEIFNLAMAFCKYRLPPSKVKMLNIVSGQLRELGEFFRTLNVHIRELGGISSASLATGFITSSELESIISTLVLRRELFYETGGDEANDPLSVSNHSNNATNHNRSSTKASTKSTQSAQSSNSPNAVPTKSVPDQPEDNNHNNNDSGSSNNHSNLVIKANSHDDTQPDKPITIPQKRRSSLMQSFVQGIQSAAVSLSSRASNLRRSVIGIKPLNADDFKPEGTQVISQQNKAKPQSRQSVTPQPKAEMHEEFAKYLDVEEKRHLENVVKMLSGDVTDPHNRSNHSHTVNSNSHYSLGEDEKIDEDMQRRHSIVKRYTVLTSAKFKPSGETAEPAKEVVYLEFQNDSDDDDDDLIQYQTHQPQPQEASLENNNHNHQQQQQQQKPLQRNQSQPKIKSPKRNSTANGFQKMLDTFTNRVDHVRRASTYYSKGGF